MFSPGSIVGAAGSGVVEAQPRVAGHGQSLHHGRMHAVAVAPNVQLLEREATLDALRGALSDAASGSGKMIIATGEAGVGKTTVIRRFCDERAPNRVPCCYLTSACCRRRGRVLAVGIRIQWRAAAEARFVRPYGAMWRRLRD